MTKEGFPVLIQRTSLEQERCLYNKNMTNPV